MNPWELLKSAAHRVRGLNYAIGVVGLVAAVAIAGQLVGDFRVAWLGSVAVLFLMVTLLIVQRLTDSPKPHTNAAGTVMLWLVVGTLAVWVTLITSSVLGGWPRDLRHWIGADQPPTERPKDVGSNLSNSGGEEGVPDPRLEAVKNLVMGSLGTDSPTKIWEFVDCVVTSPGSSGSVTIKVHNLSRETVDPFVDRESPGARVPLKKKDGVVHDGHFEFTGPLAELGGYRLELGRWAPGAFGLMGDGGGKQWIKCPPAGSGDIVIRFNLKHP